MMRNLSQTIKLSSDVDCIRSKIGEKNKKLLHISVVKRRK